MERPVEVDRHDAAPLLEGVLRQPCKRAHPGVVEHHGQAAELGDGRADGLLDLVVVGHVGDQRDPVHLVRDLGNGIAVEVKDGHPGAFFGEPQCGGAADAARAARHQGPMPVQFPHRRAHSITMPSGHSSPRLSRPVW